MVVALSSLDIHYLIKEFEHLIDSKIEKIFQMENELTFLFQLHVASKGKEFFFISLPSTICLTDFKPEFPITPPPFCSSLRRKITNARIRKISQHNFERIIVIEMSTSKGDSKLILELFSPGNMILVDSENKILSVAKSQNLGNRFLRPGVEYNYPPTKFNPINISKEDFLESIKTSDKESIVKMLAIDLSLGGDYAEELLNLSEIDKSIPPNELIQTKHKNLNNLYSNFTLMFEKDSSPLIYESKKIYAFKLKNLDETKIEKTNSLNEAISQLELKHYEKTLKKETESKKTEEISKIDKIINMQSNQIKGLDDSQITNQKKGELIYANYTEIKKILDLIKEEKKTKSWKEIKNILKNNPLFNSLEEHEGIITLNLE